MESVAVYALSHHGVLRDHNEDSVVVGPWVMCASVTEQPQGLRLSSAESALVAVADGLGGHPAGDLASTVAVQTLSRAHSAAAESRSDERSVETLVQACNHAVYDAAALDDARTGMGTTLAGVVIGQESVVAFNVGDSRVYVLGESGLRRLSVDDNPPLAPGETHTPVLTQMLGGHSRRKDVDVHLTTCPRAEAPRILVCTDGLSDVVDEPRIAALLAEYDGAQAVTALWRAALDAGGPDNVTLALVERPTPG